MWGGVVRLIGSRRAADIKRAAVTLLPSPVLGVLNQRVLKLVPPQFYEKDVIFIHVAKAAGTSIAQAVYGAAATHAPARYLRKADPGFFARTYKFAVARDPYDRLLSAYRFLKAGGTAAVPVERPADYRGREFAEFGSFVVDWLKPRFGEIRSHDYVLWPQHWFVCDESGEVLVDRVFHFEKLGELEVDLRARGLLTGSLPHANAGEIDALGPPALTPSVRDAIFSLYRRDFELFGYPSGN